MDYRTRVDEILSRSRKVFKENKDNYYRINPKGFGFLKKKNSSSYVPSLESDFYPEIKKDESYMKPVATFAALNIEKRPYFELAEMNGINHKVFSPEVDGFKWYEKNTTTRTFFNKLKTSANKNGQQSFLIDYFAQCEDNNLPYVYDNFCFIKTYPVKLTKDGIEENGIVYFVKGGFREIHRLMEIDNDFLIGIINFASLSKLFKIQEIHICADWTYNLTKFIKKAIKKGHLKTNGQHPLVIGSRNGEKFIEKCGHQSKNWKNFQNENYELESLYIGDSRTSEDGVLLYDKEKQNLTQFGSTSSTKVRLEVQINLKKLSDDKYSATIDEMKQIFFDYFGPYASWARSKLYLKLLNKNLKVTLTQRGSKLTNISPWYYDLVITPLQHFVEFFGLAWRDLQKNLQDTSQECPTHRYFHIRFYEKLAKLGFFKKVIVPSDFVTEDTYLNINVLALLRKFRGPNSLRPLIPLPLENMDAYELWPYCDRKRLSWWYSDMDRDGYEVT
jgi:hypothetical protein